MRALHVPFCFYPDAVGGTEVYVAALCRALAAAGVEPLIAAPAEAPAAYRHDGLEVRRFAIGARVGHLRELYDGAGDPQANAGFAALLDADRPDLVHLHAFNRGASLGMVAAAQARGIPVAFSYHLPGVTCQRGTLLRWGAEPCDGALRAHRCASCSLHSQGLPRPASLVLGHLPRPAGRALGRLGLRGGLWTALQMPELIAARHRAVAELIARCDAIVALCAWARDLLLRLGAPPGRLALSRHAIDYDAPPPQPRPAGGPLRVAFLGRLYPLKGADVLIRAVRARPELDLRLDLYGVTQEEHSARYRAELLRLAAGDPRVRLLPPAPNRAVVALLAGYDLLAVPSQCLETGPLVVLEGFAAGLPVLGSNLGGVAELVRDGVDGALVEPADPAAWAAALARLAADRPALARLRAGVRPPRRMAEAAAEMRDLYAGMLAGRAIA